METLFQDLRHAQRMLVQAPAFAIVAIWVLALGIGANTAIFSVVNSILLQPLPYTDPDRLVRLALKSPNGTSESVSIPKFMAWKQHTQPFSTYVPMTSPDRGGISAATACRSRSREFTFRRTSSPCSTRVQPQAACFPPMRTCREDRVSP